ncbi:MAG TPA: glucose-6-phosphate dehydrogenase, partial [Candidatus Paceibacterota bacterium]|nr:glucose-6-phosphate dehydrogenase [Candidatus Paceibacterota bacterium]
TAFLRSARWRGVPFVLESGKRMKRNIAEVEIVFRHEAPCLCPDPLNHYQNVLRYEIQPSEKIALSFWVKRPGAELLIEEKDFAFDYHAAYDSELFLDSYEKLLLDTVLGNQTLFVSTDEIKASWRYIDPVIRAWQEKKVPLMIYPPGFEPDPAQS